ncbi:MAG: hypothetical protein ABJH98_17670 [Reichenbachiella sp.]|uniref:hypothetical protein n=1 Tax=Reichenbachiella sp. TaxID=2184521 RepID=UPI003298A8EC
MEGLKVKAFKNGYTGGKEAAGTAQKIINEIRPFDVLIIPFLGNCAVTRNIDLKGANVYGVDINPDVIRAWREEGFEFIELIEGVGWDITSQLLATQDLSRKQVCIYCDPSYRMSSIKSDRAPYRFTMTDEEHFIFLECAELWSFQANVDVIISHYPDELYDSRLKNWRKIKFKSTTRQGSALEHLYMSYDHEDGVLQDYRFVGDDKHERYNLKHRAAKNLVSKLERLEVRKRQAMIHYLKKYLENEFGN